MPVTPNEDERAISEMAVDFFRRSAPLEGQSTVVDDWRTLHREMGQLGFFATTLPEAVGGLELSPLSAGLIAEAAGRELVPGPWIDQLIATRLLVDDPAALAPLLGGERFAAVWLPGRLDALPALDREERTVSGVVHGVRFGSTVDRLVLALDGTVVVIDPAASGVEIADESTMDPLWRSSTVRLDGAPVETVVPRTDADAKEDRAFASGLVAAASVGAASRALESALEHVRHRNQFGRPVGSFQALKHRAANSWIGLLHARSMVRFALAELPQDGHPAHVARVAADGAARQVAENALQMHGGIGFTSEAHIHLFLKNAQQLRGWPYPVEDDLRALRDRLDIDRVVEGVA